MKTKTKKLVIKDPGVLVDCSTKGGGEVGKLHHLEPRYDNKSGYLGERCVQCGLFISVDYDPENQ